jgi:hypothetical protein
MPRTGKSYRPRRRQVSTALAVIVMPAVLSRAFSLASV